MFTPVNDPPTFVTPEEHAQITSSTPDSFSDIPPALRFHDTEVEIEIDPKLEFLSERVKGTLWVTEK
jgi:nucleotide-sensitive chloride channel 1A